MKPRRVVPCPPELRGDAHRAFAATLERVCNDLAGAEHAALELSYPFTAKRLELMVPELRAVLSALKGDRPR